MTDTETLRPTPQRISKADHVADDGSPTKERPYIRAARLGTAWDRYSRDRGADGKLLDDEAMILTRRQIAAGRAYIEAAEGAQWGYPGGTKLEPSTPTGRYNLPAGAIDRGIKLRKLEDKLSPEYMACLIQLVLLEGRSAEDWARLTGRHPKSGIEILRVALDQMGEE